MRKSMVVRSFAESRGRSHLSQRGLARETSTSTYVRPQLNRWRQASLLASCSCSVLVLGAAALYGMDVGASVAIIIGTRLIGAGMVAHDYAADV